MKKLITILIIAYLSFTINSSAATEVEEKLENKKVVVQLELEISKTLCLEEEVGYLAQNQGAMILKLIKK